MQCPAQQCVNGDSEMLDKGGATFHARKLWSHGECWPERDFVAHDACVLDEVSKQLLCMTQTGTVQILTVACLVVALELSKE